MYWRSYGTTTFILKLRHIFYCSPSYYVVDSITFGYGIPDSGKTLKIYPYPYIDLTNEWSDWSKWLRCSTNVVEQLFCSKVALSNRSVLVLKMNFKISFYFYTIDIIAIVSLWPKWSVTVWLKIFSYNDDFLLKSVNCWRCRWATHALYSL